ncbi:MAG: cysteine hydrolase [Desulfuromonadaceae bacterium]|nr:cysteine hydrolase [Desulfuromonadaceae bacterium]
MANTAVLLLDFINDIVHPDGKLGAAGYAAQVKTRDVLQRANETAQIARSKNVPVIFVRVGFSSDYRECPDNSPLFSSARHYGALRLENWATEIHSALLMDENDFLITKHRVSAFYSTSLEAILRRLKVQTLLLGGVATNLVVQSTALDAHDRDYRVVILEDLCAALSERDHESGIANLANIGIIAKSVEMISYL